MSSWETKRQKVRATLAKNEFLVHDLADEFGVRPSILLSWCSANMVNSRSLKGVRIIKKDERLKQRLKEYSAFLRKKASRAKAQKKETKYFNPRRKGDYRKDAYWWIAANKVIRDSGEEKYEGAYGNVGYATGGKRSKSE